MEDLKIKFSNFTFQIWDSIPEDFDMGVDYIQIVKYIVLKQYKWPMRYQFISTALASGKL